MYKNRPIQLLILKCVVVSDYVSRNVMSILPRTCLKYKEIMFEEKFFAAIKYFQNYASDLKFCETR
jgi:hypothetical protein